MIPDWTRTVRRAVLPNGLTLLVQADPDSPAVAVVTHVKAGFFDEPDQWGGIAHVLEHMFFKGTPTRGPGVIAQETKAAGGYLNAGTGYDHTSYYTVLPATSLTAALDIQSDALRHPAIDPGELARELQVIIEEAKRKRDSPGAVAHETMHAVLFDHHRIRRWRIGDEARLAEFRREDVEGYYRTRYVPDRTIVAIVGGVDADEALRLAEARYADWPATPAALDPPVPEAWRREVRVRTIRGDVRSANLVLGWRAVPVLDPGRPALEMAAAILSNGRSAWLQEALRQSGIVTSVSAGLMATAEVGVFSISAEMAPDRIPDALREVGRQLRRLGEAGPSDEDLHRARTLLRARWARWLESVDSRASGLAMAEATDGYQWLDRAYAEFMAVDAGQVRAAAAEWLRADAVAAVAYLPADEGAELSVDAVRTAFQGPPRRHLVTRRGGTSVVRLPALEIRVRRKVGAPLATVRLHRRRRAPEERHEAGVGLLVVRSAVRGAGGMDGASLSAAFERIGGSVSGAASADAFGFGATVLVEHCRRAAELLREVLWRPTLAAATVGVERDTLVREAAQLSDDMMRYPFQLAFGAAFNDQWYGVPGGGTAESLSGLDAAAAQDWLARELEAQSGVLVVVGELDPEETAERLAEQFDDLTIADAAPIPPSHPAAMAPVECLRVATRDRQQSAIAAVFPGPSRLDPTRHAAEVWAAAAGGLGGRLFEALRDKRSLAYSVIASSWQRLHAGALLTYIATSPSREEEAREQMAIELERFRADGLYPGEAERAVAYLAGQALVSRQTGADLAAEMIDHWLADAPHEEFEDPAAPYRGVTPEEVHDLVRRCLAPELRVEGMVRGGARPPG